MQKSVTLVELIIATALLGVIILGAISFHLYSERLLTSSEAKTKVLNELTLVLQHLHKNVLLGTGDLNNPGVNTPAAGILTIRQDLTSGGTPLGTPDNYSDDRTVRYEFDIAAHVIRFRVDGSSWQILSSRLVNINVSPLSVAVVDGGVRVSNLALREDPAQSTDDSSNPQVSTIDVYHKPTVYFYPLLHSWR